MKIKNLKFKKRTTLSQGFSLIELLITMSIMMIVSGLVFFNHSRFNSNILIENLAYEISLTIRQAQSFGWLVKETSGGFEGGYGVHFDSDSDEFLIFADTHPSGAPNHIYDAGSDEIIDELKMMNNNKIDQLCVETDCSAGILDISFVRPNPDAFIRADGSGTDKATAEIHVISPKGLKKKILINKIGQISIEN